jgi:hypothetical protein
MEKPVERLGELEDLEYLVELSEAMKDDELAAISIAVADFILHRIRKEKRRDC